MLDIEQPGALVEYLRAAGHIQAGDSPQVEVLAGGVSNRTVLVRLADGREWVVKQALEQLRTQAEWHSDPARIHREVAGLRWLGSLGEPVLVPELVFEDHEHHLLGMTAVPSPHQNLKTVLLNEGPQEEHIGALAGVLSTIHVCGAQQHRHTAVEFEDRSFFESLRLEPYYAYTATRVPDSARFLDELSADCRACRQTVVHGDFSPKNVLVHGHRLYLLDHEVIHFGDPAFDVGFMLAHLLSKANSLRRHRAAFAASAAAFFEGYHQGLGRMPDVRSLEERAARHTLGCLLARVAGRSPVEYLDQGQRQTQQETVLGLMGRPPLRLSLLIQEFTAGLDYAEN